MNAKFSARQFRISQLWHHHVLVGWLCAGISIAWSHDCYAQFGQTTNGGTFGGRTLGGNVTAGNRTMTGAPGNQGGVGQGFGGTGVQAGMTQQASDAGSLSGNERFLRKNRQGAFVGRDLADSSNFIGQDSGGQFSALQNLGLLRAAQNGNLNAGNNAERRPVPVAYQVAFEHRSPAPTAIVAAINKRLSDRIARNSALNGVRLVLEDRVLVLTGAVATEHDRDLALQLVALEPGVGQVRNDLVVGPRPAGELILPPQPESVDQPPAVRSPQPQDSQPSGGLPPARDPFAPAYVAPNPFEQPRPAPVAD